LGRTPQTSSRGQNYNITLQILQLADEVGPTGFSYNVELENPRPEIIHSIQVKTYVDGEVNVKGPAHVLGFPQLLILLSAAFALELIAGVFLLLFLFYSSRRRRRKKKIHSYYTVVARPHI
jgi:hypothetical protein